MSNPRCPEHNHPMAYIPATDKFHCLKPIPTVAGSRSPCGFTYTAAEVYANEGSELPVFAQRTDAASQRN